MTAPPLAVAFIGSRPLLVASHQGPALPTSGELVAALGREVAENALVPVSLPLSDGRRVLAYALEEDTVLPDGFVLVPLREAYFHLPTAEFRAIGTARQKVDWHRTHGYCSSCGSATDRHPDHEAMACSACGRLQFARLSPAVIVLVQRGREALLARSTHFTPGVYSTLAGFVEPGESLEECVHREILEEVGVRVNRLRYFGSQPHPFPHSLMAGFVADWTEGDIRIDPTEIEDARWFSADALPQLPHPMSIARALIEDFVARVRI